METANELEKLEFHHFKNKLIFAPKNVKFLPVSTPSVQKILKFQNGQLKRPEMRKKINYFLAMNRVFDLKQIPGLNQSFDIAKGRLESRL